ncbi:unnamed protein product [Soboliphyme baturini]|uniref:UDENN domain-containing protein n=1 Tax=Soboliphyme baturini TaxID=241478 RepID=A0A183J1Z4_9BILA|nr:unnamed protein product [Soboliphyme baturini]
MSGSILYVFVVGFHHKRGCQVEYSYPPINNKTRISDEDLPPEWKTLPSLALPDGAHNFEKDSVFFHLPSLEKPNQTVYGVSCYRQISSQTLLNRSEDVTRCTVQKSVCVLSVLPLYGLLKAELEAITQVYFSQCDFDKVELLAEMYEHLKRTINISELKNRAMYGTFGRSTFISSKLVLTNVFIYSTEQISVYCY